VKQEEQREAKALRKFKNKENFLVYTTMASLREELHLTHQSGLPKYTPAMQVEIVSAQLQYRRDCLARCLRPGALCSNFKGTAAEKLKALLINFKAALSDEGALPSLLKPPSIRRKYTSHMFATALRTQLDRDRNKVTKAMTEAFLAAYEGGVFTGWRCTVDYSLSRPLNPEALVGQRVAKIFDADGVEYEGKIIAFNKWWKVQYDDGDLGEYNYRELANFAQPPDFDCLAYDSPAADFEAFMKVSGGSPSTENPTAKAGEPGVFCMECKEWCFISVFLVPDSKVPIQGAYMLRSDFQEETRDLTLRELKEAHPAARLSPMEDIQSWIERSGDLLQE
jgi:hypothetical protein